MKKLVALLGSSKVFLGHFFQTMDDSNKNTWQLKN
jgi:hypothetical protein